MSYVQTALTGGPYIAQWSLAYGHNTVSLASAEAATTKAPRRLPLPYIQAVTAAQAVSTRVGIDFFWDIEVPIFLQPGEFIQLVKKKVCAMTPAVGAVPVITLTGYWE